MELAPKAILKERYEIIHKLGQGGMGAVYMAHDIALEHVVAVKANRNPLPQGSNQFLREARLLAALRHPNLPRVTDYFIINEVQYLVMDYIPGDDLNIIIKETGVQPLEMVLQWASQIGSALVYLHNQNPPVIHRDIKPGNIKLMPSGEVVLVDFGIAKSSDSSQATTSGMTGFTPGYAPPEQYGATHTGTYTDQYAFAATLYHLLTNQHPVDSLQRIMGNAVLTPMNLLNPKIPAPIQAAIEKAMSLHPEERFPSVEEFVKVLTNPANLKAPAVSVETSPANPVASERTPTVTSLRSDLSKQTIKGQPRHRVWLVGAIIALIVLAGLASTFFIFKPFSGTQPPTATASSLAMASTATVAPTGAPATSTAASTVPSVEPTAVSAPLLLGKGGEIAYVSDKGDGKTMQIWLMTVALNDKGEVYVVSDEQLTTDPVDKSQPVWSPDGKKLLYVADSGGATTKLDIWELDLSNLSLGALDLSKYPGDDFDPAWSPDGQTIAFANQGAIDVNVTRLYVMNADGSQVTRYSTTLQEMSPAWSPDSKYLAYVVKVNNHEVLYLRYLSEGYGVPHQFDMSDPLGRLGDVADPAWSPDGTYIAYTKMEGSMKRIYLARFQDRGNRITSLSDADPQGSHVADYEPSWSPDSQWIVFTSDESGKPDICIMNLQGNKRFDLTNDPYTDEQPAWQPVP
ncbi:MAG TPA: protein kinase [Longilinea sp.]|nr:protein kinase [Longilinea sp.]